jgi:aryl carrier-like protein
VQHFPSADYLLDVLKKANDVLRPSGFVFVGDVRSLPLLRAFHTSVQLHRAPAELPTGELLRRIEDGVASEEELVLDPGFFRQLPTRTLHVDTCQPKRGRHRNELTLFRYDVVLRKAAAEAAAEFPWLIWPDKGMSPELIRQALDQSASGAVGFRGVPNARLSADIMASDLLRDGHGPQTAGLLRELVARQADRGYDPEDFWGLKSRLPCDVEVRWSPRGPGFFDVILTKPGVRAADDRAAHPARRGEPHPPDNPQRHANDPGRIVWLRELASRLRAYLRDVLPEHMVPSAIMFLESLPLSPNGKVDRRTLPEPARGRSRSAAAYAAPRSDLEEKIVEIWQEVLGAEPIGIDDDFFECGGDSLKVIHAVARLRSLGIGVSVAMLFDRTTVRSLAEEVGSDGQESSDRVARSRERGKRRAAAAARLRRWRRMSGPE